MANNRKKRCTNPACRRVFSYRAGEIIRCPWCGKSSRQGWRIFRFGVDPVPALWEGTYNVCLERLATGSRLKAVKAYRNLFKTMEAHRLLPGLKESVQTIDGLAAGRGHSLFGIPAKALSGLMAEGQMDLSFRPAPSQASRAKRRGGKGSAVRA